MRKTKQQQNRQLFLIYGIIYVFLVYLCIVFAPYWTGTTSILSPKWLQCLKVHSGICKKVHIRFQ